MAKPKKRRNLSAAQIKAGFGGKRRQSAQKAARKRNRPKKRKSSASHRPRTKPNAPRAAPPKKRRKSSAPKANKPKRKRNVGGIFALTNPAKGHKHVAKTKKQNKKRSSKSNAGHRHHPKKKMNRGRRHNPGQYGSPTEWLTGGIGAVIGGVGAPALTQLAMGTSNTGPVGYFGNAVAVAILAAASHFGLPRQKFLTMGIIFGGVGSIFRRIIGDYSLLGSYSSSVSGVSGLGDYLMNFNWPIPQYLQPGNNRSLVPIGGGAPATLPVVNNAAAATAPGMSGSLYGPRLY